MTQEGIRGPAGELVRQDPAETGKHLFLRRRLDEEAPQNAGADGGTDDTGRIAGHSVHQQKVGGVFFEAHYMHFAGRTGDCGDTRSTQ